MTIIGARWTPRGNLIRIGCGCGKISEHRADRFAVRCPGCGEEMDIRPLRAAWVASR